MQCGFYAIGKIVFGVTSDTAAPLILLLGGLAGIALSVLLMMFSTNSLHFSLVAVINGFLQGSGWPSITKLLKSNYKQSQFGVMFTIASSSNNVAGFIGPFLTTFSWRKLCLVSGLIGLFFCIFSWLSIQSCTKMPNVCSDANALANIGVRKKLRSSFFRKALRTNIVWVAIFFYSLTMSIRVIAESWMPIFITKVMSRSAAVLSASLFEIAGFFGTVISGLSCDFISLFCGLDRSRYFVCMVSSIGMCCSLAFVFFSNWILTWSALLGFFNYSSMTAWSLVVADMTDLNYTGTCTALISFFGNAFSMLSGTPLSILIGPFGFQVISVLSTLVLALSTYVLSTTRSMSLHLKLN